MRNFTLPLFIAILFLAQPFSAICNNDLRIDFIDKTSFRDIQDLAYEQDKPIFITFHAVWSSPCQKVRNEVFANDKVAEYMNQNFINFSANIESKIGSALAEYYDVYDLPTTLIISPKGKVIVKSANIDSPKKFMKWAKQANETYISSKSDKMGNIHQPSSQNKNEKATSQVSLNSPKIKQ